MTKRRRRRVSRDTAQAWTNASRRKEKLLKAATIASGVVKNKFFAQMYAYAIEHAVRHKNFAFIEFMSNLKQAPVSIEEFIDSPDFMGATDLSLWPVVRTAIIEINRYWYRGLAGGEPGERAYIEALLMGACVDRDTEFLTPTGWKKISEYVEGDLVAEYIPTSETKGRAEYVAPKKYVKLPIDEFIHFNPRGGIDQMLTPGHIVPYVSQKGRLSTAYAEDVERSQLHTNNGWQGRIVTTFTPEVSTSLPLSDVEIRVMVAVAADGSFQTHVAASTRCRMVFKKSRKIVRFQRLMDEWGGEYRRRDREDGYTEFTFYAPERNKTFAGWYSASVPQLRTVCDEVLHWDGNEHHAQFYTTERASADFIQYAFSATGTRATMQQQQLGNRSVEYRVKACRSPLVSMSTSTDDGKHMPTRVPSEDGYCYCFTMPRTKMWVARRNGCVFITHNTSCGKSEIAKVTTAYHLHILGCLKSAQPLYGLPKATTIVFVIQAAKPHVTKKVIYAPLRSYIETMPWFIRNMRPHKLIESEMFFEGYNIRVVPGGSDADAVLGEAIIGGVVDEINFMNVVKKSKKAEVGTGRSGTYDQAQNIYDTITRRRKGRFLTRGPEVGVVCVASSTRYKGDFTDRRKAQVEDTGERGVYIYEKAQYEARPADTYCGDTFRVVIENDAAMDIRLVEAEDRVPEHATVFEVPVEFRDDFIKDPSGALRDVIGRSVNSINPFFRSRHKLTEAVQLGLDLGLESFLYKDNVVLGTEGMPRVKRGHYCSDPSRRRYVHIDLSANGDRCGIALVRFDGMKTMRRGGGITERLPTATVEMAVTIEPDHSCEIDIAEVRAWVHALKVDYGFPIAAVSYDGWSSLESQQQWRKQGMKTGTVSVDKPPSTPYKCLRDALNDNRIVLYPNDVLMEELYDLEFDETTQKVDHPPNGYKDCADAVCGAFYTMLKRSATWMDTDEDDGGRADDCRAPDTDRFDGNRA